MILKPVEKIEVIVLMDNLSDPFSDSHLALKRGEAEYRETVLKDYSCSGANFCRACLGLSLLIRVTTGERQYSLLFDTGPDEGLAVENAKRLQISLAEVDAIILSHGHFDHISGVVSCLNEIKKTELPVYTHRDTFAPRAWQLDDGQIYKSSVVTKESVHAAGGYVETNIAPKTIFDDHVLLSGEVPRHTSYETGLPGEKILLDNIWIDAPVIIDEQNVIIQLRNKGLCVFTGCGHTGVVNALRYAQALTDERVHLIMGGFHLTGRGFSARIVDSVSDLKAISPDYLITGHCTGIEAQAAFSSAFGESHIPYSVGANFTFTS